MDLHGSIDEARGGDAAAFAAVYRALQPAVLRYLRVAVGDHAEDVASEAWLEVAREIRTFRGDLDGFRRWLFTIVRHRAIDHRRAAARRSSITVADVPERAAPDDVVAAVLDNLDSDSAIALLRRLPPDQAEAVALRVIAGLDVAQTAQVLGKRAGAVRIATMRGLRRLEDLLAPASEPAADSAEV